MIMSVGLSAYNSIKQTPYVNNTRKNTQGDLSIQKTPQISFGQKPQSKLSLFITTFFKNTELEVKKVLDRSRTFGIKEYKKLTQQEKIILEKELSRECRSDTKDIMHLSNTLKHNLEQRFPDGFTFVAIGRSPAQFADIFKYQGLDTITCPISDLKGDGLIHKRLSSEKVTKYGEFLKTLGISKETIENASKPFVFVDYTYNGASLHNFEQILKRDEIKINSPNAVFLSLNEQLLTPIKDSDKKHLSSLIEYFLDSPQLQMKNYAPCPKVSVSDMAKADKIVKKHKQKEDVKLMQFSLINYLDKNGLLKG